MDDAGNVLYWLGVSTDIHDQKTSSEMLERIVAERTLALRRSNEELEQFAYIASHDMKEPLRKILVFSERLLDKEAPEDKLFVQRIRDSALRMTQLVNDLLEFSSIEQQVLASFEPVDLNGVLASALQDLELQVLERSATIDIGPLPVVPGIRHQLHQLFTNLLGNALKYTRPGVSPQVAVRASAATSEDLARFPELDPSRPFHRILIADNGIGFATEQAERIFTLFQRLHSRESFAGTGVGLALCRKVARGHGGEIYALAEPDAGARFYVLLPA
jgi:signal transduction histidine kinase